MIPTSGFPQVSGMETSDNSDTVQTVHLIQHMHLVHGGSSRGYTFEACNRGGTRFVEEVVVHGRSGGRRSRGDVEEVDVRVHVTRVFGNGRRTWFGVVLGESA